MLSDSEAKVIGSYLEMLFYLLRERGALDKRLRDLETSVRSILALHDDDDAMPFLEKLDDLIRPEGFTDAIRRVLKSSDEALTPAEVKERLPRVGFRLEGYSNPLASIHTILKRIARTESVDPVEKDGKAAYKWKHAKAIPVQGVLNPLGHYTSLGQILKSMQREEKKHRPGPGLTPLDTPKKK